MIGVSAGPILPAFGPVPTAVDMPVGVLRRKHDYQKKKKKKSSANPPLLFYTLLGIAVVPLPLPPLSASPACFPPLP